MVQTTIFFPVLAQVFLTYAVLVFLFRARVKAMIRSGIRMGVLRDPAREAEAFKGAENPADNFENLFEMPVLFYVATGVIFMLQINDSAFLGLAWAYVASRIFHSAVHCTSNRIRYRFRSFALSAAILLVIWVRISLVIFQI